MHLPFRFGLLGEGYGTEVYKVAGVRLLLIEFLEIPDMHHFVDLHGIFDFFRYAWESLNFVVLVVHNARNHLDHFYVPSLYLHMLQYNLCTFESNNQFYTFDAVFNLNRHRIFF